MRKKYVYISFFLWDIFPLIFPLKGSMFLKSFSFLGTSQMYFGGSCEMFSYFQFPQKHMVN